jgi:hypothetical protein
MTEQALDGVIFAWMEQGMEGTVWAFQDERHVAVDENGEPKWSYSGLHVLENGDHLIVFDIDGSIRWQGVVDLDMQVGRDPKHGMQTIRGTSVLGVQRGIAPETWARMFLDEPQVRLIKARFS